MRQTDLQQIRVSRVAIGLFVVLGLCCSGLAIGLAEAGSEFFVYPGKGQGAEQQKKDEFDCYNWAKNNTGFDPMAPPTTETAPPPQQEKKGGVLRGAAGGALLGVGIGAIAGDAGKGAAIGAASGGLIGGMRRRDQTQQQQQAEQQWAQQEAGKYQAKRNDYNRAYRACLEGRGYTVK